MVIGAITIGFAFAAATILAWPTPAGALISALILAGVSAAGEFITTTVMRGASSSLEQEMFP